MKQEQLEPENDATEVAPGVVRIQLPVMLPGLGHVNCYVLEDDRGVSLVDPGLPGPDAYAELVRRVERAGYPMRRVHTVVVTHSHPDHFGGAGRLSAESGCGVVAHELFMTPFDQSGEVLSDDLVTLDDVTDHDEVLEGPDGAVGSEHVDGAERLGASAQESGADRLRRILFGSGPIPQSVGRDTPWGEEGLSFSEAELEHIRGWDDMSKHGLLSLTPTQRVADQQVIRIGHGDWTVVHTPGHTGDHICLFDPVNGTMLSGDHVLPTITPHISGLTPEPDALNQFFVALRRVAAIDGVRMVLPAHGLPFTDLAGRAGEIIEHHHERLGLLRDIAREIGDATVRAYSHRLFRERSWGPMAESETYAHLEHLRLAGEMVRSSDPDAKFRYELVPTD